MGYVPKEVTEYLQLRNRYRKLEKEIIKLRRPTDNTGFDTLRRHPELYREWDVVSSRMRDLSIYYANWRNEKAGIKGDLVIEG